MKDRHDCWTCMNFGDDLECHADVKGGTQYEGWKPPCKNWKRIPKKIRCLYVKAPFAKWIVTRIDGFDTGVKLFEYRTKPTNIRGRIGIIQSGTGTVIGDVEIVGCKFSSKYDLYMWELKSPRRYVNPVPFTSKRGAIVWTNVDYDPDEQDIMDAIPKWDAPHEFCEYGKALDAFFERRKK